MIKITSFDNFERELEKLQNMFEKVEGTRSIPMDEILNPEFMIRFTIFSSLDDLIEKSGYTVETEEDFERIPDKEWDEFISAHTQFSSWQDMLDLAANEYFQQQLDVE